MFFKKYQNILRKSLSKALPLLLVFYFISFRFSFLSQQFFAQDVSNFAYFDVLKSGDFIANAFAKIDPTKDEFAQKLAFKNFAYEYKFLLIENFALAFLLLTIIFYYKNSLKILSPPLAYRNRAPPVIC